MKKVKASTLKNITFLGIIILLIIPSSRLKIQVFLNKGLALFSPSIASDSKLVSNYEWKLKTLDQTHFNFNETKGQVTFLNFWATWCPPCIAEMQSIENLYKDYGKKINFVLVSSEAPKTIQSFLNKNNYTFNSFTITQEPPETFKVSSIPRTFLISKNGEIIIDETGAANWNSDKVRRTIDKLLLD